ncbi:MAG: 16S rRNA processing protein RimM [Deltaproteobacteria bacterium]|nr:16S rRNA processing protein RimM [Deltaproteobacteria bacterium]
MNKVATVVIGKVTGVHGIEGELKVFFYMTAEADAVRGGSVNDLSALCNTLYIDGNPYILKGLRPHKNVFLVSLEGLTARAGAEALVGKEVSVEKEKIPQLPEGEFYWSDLLDMEVHSEDGSFLGRVVNIFSTGGNDVLEVKGPRGEFLLPATEGTFLDVDVRAKRLKVRLLEGLVPEDRGGKKKGGPVR